MTIKRRFSRPLLHDLGTLASITAAIGSSSNEDQSDFPQQFPPGTGSFDVCNNNNPDTVC